jgi:hypothetical protein
MWRADDTVIWLILEPVVLPNPATRSLHSQSELRQQSQVQFEDVVQMITLHPSSNRGRAMETVPPTTASLTPRHHGRWYKHLYVQALGAILLGVLLGHFYPSLGEAMKPLGDAFVKMIKMLIAPIIF